MHTYQLLRAAQRNTGEGLSLLRRRTWYAEEQESESAGTAAQQSTETGTGGSSAGTKNTDTPTTVPYERFTEVNQRRKELEKELEAFRTAQAEAQAAEEKRKKEEAEKRGEFEALYTTEREKAEKLAAEIDELKRYKALYEEQLKAQREGLPDHIQELLSTMTPLQQAEYLTKHGDKLRQTRAPGLDGGTRGNGKQPRPVKPNPIVKF